MKSSKKAECYADIFAKKEVRYTSFFIAQTSKYLLKSVITSFKKHYIDRGIFKSYTSIEVVNIASVLKCYHFVINFSRLSRGYLPLNPLKNKLKVLSHI